MFLLDCRAFVGDIVEDVVAQQPFVQQAVVVDYVFVALVVYGVVGVDASSAVYGAPFGGVPR